MKILITGTPATGKTTLCKNYCKIKDYTYISINEIVDKYALFEGVDKTDNARIVKLRALAHKCNQELDSKNDCLIDGHLGCDMHLNVDCVVVLRTDPRLLVMRMKERGYDEHKISQNRLSEILDYCTIRSLKHYDSKNVFEIDLSDAGETKAISLLEEFIKIKDKSRFLPSADFSDQLLDG